MNSPLKSPVLKTLLLSDQHMKSAALVNWIASHQSAPLKRLNFSMAGANDDHVVDYVDIATGGTAHRIIAGKIASFQQPLFLPIAHGAQKVVLLLSGAERNLVKDFAERALKEKGGLGGKPEIIFLHSPGPKDQPIDIAAWFAKAGQVRNPKIDLGDYSRIWGEISRTHVAEEVGVAPKQVDVPAAAAVAPAPVSARQVEMPVVAKEVAVVAETAEHKLKQTEGILEMANAAETLSALMQIDGAVGGLIGDYTSGMLLAKAGGGVNLDVAAAGNSEVIKAKMKTMAALGIKETIEDILITLGTQYHILRPVPGKAGLFLYLVLDKAKANLAMARFKVADVEKSLAL